MNTEKYDKEFNDWFLTQSHRMTHKEYLNTQLAYLAACKKRDEEKRELVEALKNALLLTDEEWWKKVTAEMGK